MKAQPFLYLDWHEQIVKLEVLREEKVEEW